MEITVTNYASQIGLEINVANAPAGGVLEMQASYTSDFKFCVCPRVDVANAATTGMYYGLNPGTTYYLRARHRASNGTVSNWSNTTAGRTQPGIARNTAPAAIMIEPAILVVPSPVLLWASSTERVGFPALNLGYDGPVGWSSQSGGGHVVIAEIAPEPIDTIAILNTNAAHDATVTVEGGSSAVSFTYSHTAPFRASPALPGRPGYHALIRLPSPQGFPFWRVTINSANTSNVFYAEHMIFGLNRSTKNYTKDKVETLQDLGSLDRSRNGNPHRVSGKRMRRVDFDISALSEAQYETQYGDLWQRVGATDPVLVVPNSKQGAFLHDRILYGAITGGRVVNTFSPRYTRSFTIDSVI